MDGMFIVAQIKLVSPETNSLLHIHKCVYHYIKMCSQSNLITEHVQANVLCRRHSTDIREHLCVCVCIVVC